MISDERIENISQDCLGKISLIMCSSGSISSELIGTYIKQALREEREAQWISVEESDPVRDKRILLNTVDGITTGYFALGRDEYIPDDLDLSMSDVTHWMLLQPPN